MECPEQFVAEEHHGLVARTTPLLRRVATRTDMGFLATSVAYLPSPDPSANMATSGRHVPVIYGPSGDVKWAEADPTYSVEAAKRGG